MYPKYPMTFRKLQRVFKYWHINILTFRVLKKNSVNNVCNACKSFEIILKILFKMKRFIASEKRNCKS